MLVVVLLNRPVPHATQLAWLYSFWYMPASQPRHCTTESRWPRANPGTPGETIMDTGAPTIHKDEKIGRKKQQKLLV